MPNSGKPEFGGEGGERSEPGEGRSDFQLQPPRAPHPDPLPCGERETNRRAPSEDKTLTWLALEPITGRTHQLRVHCAAMGWPIVGDDIYGTAARFVGPILHLHAREVIVPISKNRPPVRVVAPVPPHMRERLMACGWTGEEGE